MCSKFYRFLLLTAVFVVCLYVLPAQSFRVLSVNKANHVPSAFIFSESGVSGPNAENMNTWFASNLGTNQLFKLTFISKTTDPSGMTHSRYRQYCNGVPVFGSMVILHQKNNKTISMNGYYYPWLEVQTKAAISEETALKAALAQFPGAVFAWQVKAEEDFLKKIDNNPAATYYPKGQLMIISKNHSQKKEDFRLAYKFDVYSVKPLARENIFIDAMTGETIAWETLLHSAGVPARGQSMYSGLVNFTCDSIAPDSFNLTDYTRGKGIETFNGNLYQDPDIASPYVSESSNWNLKNQYFDEVAIDIQWGLKSTYDFYLNKLGINSIDDSGSKMIGVAHYGDNYNNAHWNGRYANFGDGDWLSYKPLTSIDICAHEMTHGLTGRNAGLIYKDESGALNESFSDIFGKAVEHYAQPDSFSWIVGEKIRFGGAYIRNMANPHAKSDPAFYYGRYFVTPGNQADNGGVHTNSGVQNYWYYLLCEGGTGIHEYYLSPFTVKPIGRDTASMIAFLTLRDYLAPYSGFFDASLFSRTVAEQVYAGNPDVLTQVTMAWYAVGLAEISGSGIKTSTYGNRVSLYPNPAQNELRVSLSNYSSQVLQVKIADAMGRTLQQNAVYDGAVLDTGNLSAGIYFMLFEDGSVIKFLKQ